MPRASFGGAVDYSAMFASLYSREENKAEDAADAIQDAADSDMYDKWQNELIGDPEWVAYIDQRLAATVADPREHQAWVERRRQVATVAKQRSERDAAEAEQKRKQAEAEARIVQEATDSDTFDSWQNGLIGDDEWLAYIRGRAATETDPRAKQQWIERDRQYTQSISDSQAEYQFQNGQISAAAYIAYHQKTLGNMDPDSQVYRDRKKLVTDLVDATLQNDIQGRAQEIIDRIPSGNASYTDLLKLYKEAQAKARPGSDLAAQIGGKISEVQQAISDNEANGSLERIEYLFKAGKLSGTAAGKQIRAVADKHFKGDQAKYYNLLESALGFEKYGAANYGESTGGGGGGRRSGGGGGGSKAPSTTSITNQLRANISRGVDVTDQFLNTNSGQPGQIFDSATGKNIYGDTKSVRQIQLETLDSYDSLIDVYEAAGKPKEAANAAKAKTDFIQKAIQPVNTLGPAEQTQTFIAAINRGIVNTAKASNDPLEVLNAASEYAGKIDAYVHRLETSAVTAPVASEDTLMRGEARQVTAPRAAESQVMPGLIAELKATSQSLKIVSTPGISPEDAAAQIGLLNKGLGDRGFIPPNTLSAALEAVATSNQDHADLASGKRVLVAGPDGIGTAPTKTVGVPVVGPGGEMMGWGTETVPDIGIDEDSGQKWQEFYVDFNGKPMPVKIVSQPIPSQYKQWRAATNITLTAGGETYQFQKGSPIPSSFIGSTSEAGDWSELVAQGVVGLDNVDLGWQAIVTPAYSDSGKSFPSQVWVGDPKTGTWYVGKPPVGVELNPDGTVRIGSDLRPEPIYKPHGTAGGVPVPYVGSNNKTMQAVYTDLGLDSVGLKIVDSTGQIVDAPPGYFDKAYYDADLEAQNRAWKQSRGNGDIMAAGNNPNWWSQGIQDAKVKKNAEASATVFRADMQKNRGIGAQVTEQQSLQTLGESVGIKFSKPAPKLPSQDLVGQQKPVIAVPPPGAVKPSVPVVPIALRPAPGVVQPNLNTVGVGALPSIPKPSASASVTIRPASLPTTPKNASATATIAAPKPLPSEDLMGQAKPAPKPAAKPVPSQDLLGQAKPAPAPKPTPKASTISPGLTPNY